MTNFNLYRKIKNKETKKKTQNTTKALHFFCGFLVQITLT